MTAAGIGSSAVKAGQNPPVIVIGREEVQFGEDCGVVLSDRPFAIHKSLRNGGVRASLSYQTSRALTGPGYSRLPSRCAQKGSCRSGFLYLAPV
jgi:hypothetical protein